MDLLGTAGGLWTNRKNLEFAEEMAGSQYRRAVSDMKSAGLSPNALFASGSGSPAAAPGGQAENPVVGTLGSTAQQVIGARKELASTDKVKSEDELVKAQADTARSTARAAASAADVSIAENSAYRRALAGESGQAAAAVKKYGGSGPMGYLGGLGALGGFTQAPAPGGDSVAKRLGYWWTGTGPNSQGGKEGPPLGKPAYAGK